MSSSFETFFRRALTLLLLTTFVCAPTFAPRAFSQECTPFKDLKGNVLPNGPPTVVLSAKVLPWHASPYSRLMSLALRPPTSFQPMASVPGTTTLCSTVLITTISA